MTCRSPTIPRSSRSIPKSTEGYIDRGWIYVLNDDLDNAGADFDTALKLQENNAMALVGRGVVKSRKGKPTDGSADLKLAEQARARHLRRGPQARHQVAVSPTPRADSWAFRA